MQKDIIKKLKENSYSQEEIDQLLHYLRKHPMEVKEYFAEGETEVLYTNTILLTEEKSEQLFQKIGSRIQKEKQKQRRIRWSFSSAAALLLIFFTGYFFFTKEPQAVAPENSKAARVLKINTSKHPINILLPDSSEVVLYAMSELRFDSVFKNDRNIDLVGKASFNVARDPAKPFNVTCNNVVTSALGTEFLVDGTAESTRIELYQGKVYVFVKHEKPDTAYLFPGDYAVYNHVTSKLITGKSHVATYAKTKRIKNIREKPDEVKPLSMQYIINDNLKHTLDKLSVKYKVTITYPDEKVRMINMSMVIDSSQNIEAVLKNIAVVANLQLEKVNEKKFILK